MIDELMPPWATGFAYSYLDIGAQLCTRDGRRCGNAAVLEVANGIVTVITDAGTRMQLYPLELEALFYPPVYVMDTDTCPGKFGVRAI